ncbi:IS30 family transposase [Candidatus Poriferisodalis sp.]|uniref:IS30 family transposase n=1 Tax=Candidatus Poriferisodalis sp. TaxID=3101277 RepID=UPI003D0BF3B6
MAARLSLDERVFIESSLGAGRGVADVAQRLGRDPSTVHRELARCAGRAGYDARSAHAWACARARRVRASKLADDAVLAAAVNERLGLRWSPHATAADLRESGMSVCPETIYRACYANDARSGLPAGSWAKLPRRARRRRPRSVAQAQKPSPLGEYRPIADRPADVEDRIEPGHWDRDLIVGKANLTAAIVISPRNTASTILVLSSTDLAG